MPERTHATQQDEALRQCRDDDIRATARLLLTRLATYLTRTRPADTMIEASRKYLARNYAVTHARWDTQYADALEAALLAAMPHPRPQQTRGEYAIVIRPTGSSR
ncbi:hypothetical protein [Streptomyces sp. NPDC048338]|uniref:hypothetical protein n=1 Tax=Streptomyces sp. NPDC048338 TaxID=3365536 RepID=UPI00371F854D